MTPLLQVADIRDDLVFVMVAGRERSFPDTPDSWAAFWVVVAEISRAERGGGGG